MIQPPVIVTFANQKGGVGKDYSLCDLCQLLGDERCPSGNNRL